ncbi:inositol monophosphatase family protein [Desulfobotulus sp.]|uniref:inositol monophosphatase family protein n=1 Tax=Desulfobotulus sp. TaxID=1940337 RepID=UPI002A36D1CE|nr:inositol monophosphatase family protein [Desulfobotulus sp.]MDY0162676.1 inositol monophosphatase family protein [Desulfobotulus sp.]
MPIPKSMNTDALLHTTVLAARAGGDALMRCFGKLQDIRKKGRVDLVTEADEASEKAVMDILEARYPEHGILAEESGCRREKAPFQWVLDPLDGTTNFAHGLPFFAVSLALFHEKTPLTGCIYAPALGECFTAASGGGAYRNHCPMAVSLTQNLEDSLLATGFPYAIHERFSPVTQRFARCLYAARGIRRLGAASLDLCYLADGRFDAFWEEDLKPWDTAAGTLIAREAGALVTDFQGHPHHMHAPDILASNGRIHEPLRRLLELDP